MQTILLLVHVFAAVAMVGLILIQQGKGARLTAGLATIFFITSLSLAYFSGNKEEVATSVVDRLQPVEERGGQVPVEEKILEQLTEQGAGPSGGIPVPEEK